MPNYSGVWTLSQQFQGRGQGLWPQLPGAPTIGTATAGINNCASVAFTAPTCGVPATFTYTATSTPGGITASGAASPLTVTGLTNGTSYTFKVKATNGAGTGPCSAASNSITATVPTCATFTTAGTFSWVVPAGVTSVAMVAVGGGQGAGNNTTSGSGGRGGSLAYLNGRAVTPGTSYTVVVGAAAGGGLSNTAGNNSSVAISCTTVLRAIGGNAGGSSLGTASFAGGTGGTFGGGGAAGYAGAGGNGGANQINGTAGAGGAGGGGAGGYLFCNLCSYGTTGGGRVIITRLT